jgi:hypothetical protein
LLGGTGELWPPPSHFNKQDVLPELIAQALDLEFSWKAAFSGDCT